MKIKWSTQAELSYLENLNYWDNHNKSHSDKIDDALYKLEEEISLSPYFLAHYILYKRNFLNGKFVMYYQVLEEENLIRIIYFRSNKQKPL